MGKRTVDLRGQKPLLDIVSYGRRAPGHGRTFTPAEREQIGRTVARVCEVMIKVTGGGRSVSSVLRRLRYIDRRGGLELETDDGERLQAKGAERALFDVNAKRLNLSDRGHPGVPNSPHTLGSARAIANTTKPASARSKCWE